MTHVIEFEYHARAWTNRRGHWRDQHRAKTGEKQLMRAAWLKAGRFVPEFPCVVRFVRIAPRKLDDDNLVSSFKYFRDEMTRIFGLKDDAGTEVSWEYAEESGPPKTYRVRVEIEGEPRPRKSFEAAADEVFRKRAGLLQGLADGEVNAVTTVRAMITMVSCSACCVAEPQLPPDIEAKGPWLLWFADWPFGQPHVGPAVIQVRLRKDNEGDLLRWAPVSQTSGIDAWRKELADMAEMTWDEIKEAVRDG